MKKMRLFLFEILKYLNYHLFKDISEPGMKTAAIMSGMNFVRGRLGNTGFRRQYVSDGSGGYSRQTVAFTMPETNASNTVLQQNQRSKFKQLAVLGGMLNRCDILRKFYYSGLGISGYNAFIRDNITRGAAIKCDDGNTYVDWPKLLIATGIPRQLMPYKSSLVADVDYDATCKYPLHLRWSKKSVKKGSNGEWSLLLVGIPINEDGSAGEICILQPGATLETCYADVLLDKCECCKTYWFGFFINTYTGENTTSVYLGADASTFANLPDYDPATCCFNCEEVEIINEACVLPSDNPEFCGCGHDSPTVETQDIVFTGENNYPTFGYSELDILDAGVNDGSGYTGGSSSDNSTETETDDSHTGDEPADNGSTDISDNDSNDNEPTKLSCIYTSGTTNAAGAQEVEVGGFMINGNPIAITSTQLLFSGGVWSTSAASTVASELTSALIALGFTVNSITIANNSGSAQYDIDISGTTCPEIIIRTSVDNTPLMVTLITAA